MRKPPEETRKSQAKKLLSATKKDNTNLVTLANKVVEGAAALKKLKGKTTEPIEKGVARRLAPNFDPGKAIAPKAREQISSWQEANRHEARESLPKMEGDARVRALHKLSAAAKVRRAKDGKREFLLHRGTDKAEYDSANKDTHYSHERHSSWTPRYELASSFAEGHERKGQVRNKQDGHGKLLSAWVHEDDIHTIPKQFGDAENPRSKNTYASEHEIVIRPGHKSPKADYKPDAPKNLDQEINIRGNLKEKNPSGMGGSAVKERIKMRGKKFNSAIGEHVSVLNKNDPVQKIIEWHGMKIYIEWPKGSTRKYGDDYKKKMKCSYGYFRDTMGDDGEELDVYIGDNLKSELVFRATQTKEDGTYDETKIFIGFDSIKEVVDSFHYHLDAKRMGDVMQIPVEELQSMIKLGEGFHKSDEDSDHIYLEHYSDKEVDEIHPKFYGTGVAGNDSKRKKQPDWVDRSYHYEAGSKPEDTLGSRKYKYISKVPKQKIYDLADDHKGFLKDPKDKQGFNSMNVVERRVMEAGYHGYKHSKGPLPNAVALFHPVKPHKKEENGIKKSMIAKPKTDVAKKPVVATTKPQAGGGIKSVHFISGEQPRGKVSAKVPLEQSLKAAGYKYHKVKSEYGGIEKNDFAVVNADPKHIERLATEHGQDSVIHSSCKEHKMVFTTGPNAGKHHKGFGTVHHGKQAPKDNYSKIGDHHFTLNFDFNKLHKSEDE